MMFIDSDRAGKDSNLEGSHTLGTVWQID